MWKLKKLGGGAAVYLIADKRSYVVGRKDCDVVLVDDASVSRKHCTLYVARKHDCHFHVETSTGIWVVDENSKYGTYIRVGQEWEKLNSKEDRQLKHGTIIRFGLLDNVWSIEYAPVIVCTSGIQNTEKKQVVNMLKQINGELRNMWSSDCTLTIVNEITLTVKVVLSLINGIPIVTLAYLSKLIECIKNQTSLPDNSDYRPVMKEAVLDASLVSLDPNVTRKDLFKGLVFVFPTKNQLEILKDIVVSAGGKVELLNANNGWDRLGERNVILIELPVNRTKIAKELIQDYHKISSYLGKKYEKRSIPESEIAQAIAYSSTEKYCNVMYKNCTIKLVEYKEPNLGSLLAEETPEVERVTITEQRVVPCTSRYSQDNSVSHDVSYLPQKRNRSPHQPQSERKIPRIENHTRDSGSHQLKSDKTSKDFNGNKKSLKNDTRTSPGTKKEEKPGLLSSEGNQSKRKLSASNENSNTKKIKLPTEIDDINISETSSEEKFSNLGCYNKKSDFTIDFFEKDKTESICSSTVNELSNTIYSLNLIASVYLNADGSLIKPPDTPVNVKKFKKQKILTGKEYAAKVPEVKDEDVSGGDWLEVHPVNGGDYSFD